MKSKEIPLTSVDPVFDRQVNRTPSGMAFWAGTGPNGTTCRDCTNFRFAGFYASGKNGDMLRPGPCKRFSQLMGKEGPPLHPSQESCKYFELNPSPPSLTRPKGHQ